jgi:outer membrane murein-binding lipoprotein Lpp
MYLQLIKRRQKLVSLIITLLLAGCQVVLIGAYDPHVDASIQKISTDISTLIVKVEKNIDDNQLNDNIYSSFRDSYINILGEVGNLKIRSKALPKYNKITQQVEALEKNIRNLEALHKIGFTNKRVVEAAKILIETSLQAMLTTQNALKREKAN